MYVWKILVLIVTATVAFAGVLVFWQFCRYKVCYGWLRPALSNKVSGSVYLSDRIRMDYMLYGKGGVFTSRRSMRPCEVRCSACT